MKKKLTYLASALLAILVIVIIIIIAGRQKKANNGKTIVCSFYPVYVMTENLMEGTGVSVVNMTSTLTGCIHDYQVTTADMKTLEKAKMFIVNGVGMESFTEKILKNYPKLPTIEAATPHKDEENPHAWMSIDFEYDMIDYVSENLIGYFPEYADKIKKNTDAYADRLNEPYQKKLELMNIVENCGKKVHVICFNEAFEIFADSFELDTIAVFSLDENELPSAGEIAEAIDEAKRHDAVVIFIEEDKKEHADKIVKETGASVIFLDPLTGGDGGKDSYINGMTENFLSFERYFN